MCPEQPEKFKGFFIERNANGHWFIAIPAGELVGAWQRVERVDLVNMGISAVVLDAVRVDVPHRIQISVTDSVPVPFKKPVRVTEKSSTRIHRGFYVCKTDIGQFWIGLPRAGILCWKEAESEDLLYLGVDAADIESITSTGKYFCSLPRVRLQPRD